MTQEESDAVRGSDREIDASDPAERVGAGVDRSGIRALLRLTPAQRLATLQDEAAFIARLRTARRIS